MVNYKRQFENGLERRNRGHNNNDYNLQNIDKTHLNLFNVKLQII